MIYVGMNGEWRGGGGWKGIVMINKCESLMGLCYMIVLLFC